MKQDITKTKQVTELPAPAVMLHKSPVQEQMVALAPPPNNLVLHPSVPTPLPHSLVTTSTPSNCPTVDKQL